jgi:hypothetical protein
MSEVSLRAELIGAWKPVDYVTHGMATSDEGSPRKALITRRSFPSLDPMWIPIGSPSDGREAAGPPHILNSGKKGTFF